MPLTYTIQHTHAGDYLIRDQADRQLARFAGETEAAAWITQRQAADAAEAAEREMHERAQAAFDESMPDLNKLQLRWQRWRNWLYDALSQESRRLSAVGRALDRAGDGDSPSQRRREQWQQREEAEADRAGALYARAVALDDRIKAARRAQDAEALAEALAESEALIGEMDALPLHQARPEEWGGARVGAGRRPVYDTPMERATVTLPADTAAYLRALGGGNLSAGIRRLAERSRG